MKRKISFILSLIIVFASLGTTFFVYAEDMAEEIVIYCAPYGDDSASGTFDAPLKTLKGAKNRVEKLKHRNIPIKVYFRGGEYKVNGTTVFLKKDSGTKNAPITYAAYEGEEPIFTGATKIPVKNFKPLSVEEAARVPGDAARYIGVADLKKIGIKHITEFEGFSGLEFVDDVPNTTINLICNGREQTLAAWPNGTNNYTYITGIAGTTAAESSTALSFMIDDDGRMENWVTAENPMVYGWMHYGFSFQRVPVKEFDPQTKMVTTEFAVPRGIKVGGEVRVTNLLEELDVPGEYYVDAKNLKVYFYPPCVDDTATIEIISHENNIANLRDVSYVTFKDLTFHNNRADAFELKDCNNVQFLGCKFRNIELMAIDTMHCTDTLVDGCDFINIGSSGVRFDERNDGREDVSVDVASVRTDLTPDNNIVNNCYFWDVATQSYIYTGAIRIHGVGNKATRNAMHYSASSFIHHGGNEIQLKNNEIWCGVKRSSDMGMVYNGRSVVQRGNETAYNYFHDWVTSGSIQNHETLAIYDDDCLTGHNKHHNIFANGEDAVINNGMAYGKFDYNIVAECDTFGKYDTHGWSFWLEPVKGYVRTQVPIVCTLEEYEKYDYVKELFFQHPIVPKESSAEYNLFYKPGENFFEDWISPANEHLYAHEGNITDEEGKYYKYFNDPDNGDFTIRTDIEVPQELKEYQKIQLDDIGIYESETRKQTVYRLGEFSTSYPYNYASNVDSKSVYFGWEKSENADEYIIEIATDPEFKNMVHKDVCPFNCAYYDDLDSSETVYYWRVSAVSKMLNNREVLPSKSGTMVFRTGMYDKLDLEALKLQITEANEQVAGMTEGDGPCQVELGTKQEINKLITEASAISGLEYGNQNEVDDLVTRLKNAVDNAYTNTEVYYNDSSDMFEGNLQGWIKGETADVVIRDGEIGVYSTSDSVSATTAFPDKFMPTNSIMSIKVKPTIPEGAAESIWQAIAFVDMDYVGKRYWAMPGAAGLLIVIKANSTELQIRDGVNEAIVISSDKAMKMNEWNDVEVGIMDYGATQRCILRINGEDAVDYASKTMNIEKKMCFGLYDAMLTNRELRTQGIFAKAGKIPEDALVISYEQQEERYEF